MTCAPVFSDEWEIAPGGVEVPHPTRTNARERTGRPEYFSCTIMFIGEPPRPLKLILEFDIILLGLPRVRITIRARVDPFLRPAKPVVTAGWPF